jgi:hypothetical protein
MHGYSPGELARMKDLFSDLLHREDVPRASDRTIVHGGGD